MWELPTSLTRAIARLIHPTPKPAPPPAAAPTPVYAPDQLKLKGHGSPRATGKAEAIGLQNVHSGWVKDPSFANNGQPIAGQRYMAFGDLRHFYLKGFDAGPKGLSFKKGELPIKINGLDPAKSGLWAPQVVVQGDQVRLFYCAGKMDGGIDWASYRIHTATMPLAAFEQQAKKGGPLNFQEAGTLFDDQKTFGGENRNFGMIDPHFHVDAKGHATMTYTVVTPAANGHPHQEFVRSRTVDAANPRHATGPDTALVDGWAGGPHDGVAEAQEVVDLGGKPYLFVSSRAGDKDQKVLVAPYEPGKGPVPPEKFKPVLNPGGDGWRSNAVGSTSTAVIDGKPYMIFQGMNSDHRFTLGWTHLAMDG